MKKHQNQRYFTAVCIASAIFAVLLCLALFLIVTGDRSELERVEAQAAVFLEQMEQAADSARQSALADAQDNFENSMPGMPDASSGIQPGPADSASGKSTDETYVPSADDEYYEKITDAIRDDLPYGVEWQECDLSRKQEDASFYALYPKLTGEIRNRDYLNEIIEKQALLYKNYCQMYVEQAGFDSCHIQCFGYVTNMDSEHLSVVFDQKFYLNNQSMPGLSAINIDVETGTILKKNNSLTIRRDWQNDSANSAKNRTVWNCQKTSGRRRCSGSFFPRMEVFSSIRRSAWKSGLTIMA